ncbi:MAG: DUF6152 family protein [Gammaproteobacteria bacterium]
MKTLAFITFILLSGQLSAHHSTTVNFEKAVSPLEGQIKSIKIVNPHCSFVLEVINDDGVSEEWLVEMLAKNALERQGFDFGALQIGLMIKLQGRLGYRPNTIYFVEIELPDGRIIKNPGPLR